MSRKGFDKFINKKESGAKKKEKIRQEKKQLRAEKNAYFEEQKRMAREKKYGTGNNRGESTSKRTGTAAPQEKKPYQGPSSLTYGNKKSKPAEFKSDARSIVRKNAHSTQPPKQVIKNDRGFSPVKRSAAPVEKRVEKNKVVSADQITNKDLSKKSAIKNQKTETSPDEMPLNKFIAWSGVCGRREAADLVKAGKVTVNGTLVTEPPFRVSQKDQVKVNGKKISVQKNLVYILLNKPKDYITTTDDPEGRKTVMDLIKNATPERVFPVGRLDRNTTGVLLLTNDGEVAQRLTHPKYEVKKIYEVKLDKPVTKQQLDTIASGITLEDGFFIQPDAVAYADSKDRSIVGIEIHSGRNRIVRRIFEHLGFDVKNLDRVMYGIFTKKNVDRGKWRFLSEKEIRLLKHLNTSFSNKKATR